MSDQSAQDTNAAGDAGQGADAATLLGGEQNDAGGAGGQQQDGQNWRESLPDDLKGHASLTKFADASALAKSYVELEGKFGTPAENVLKIPTGDEPMDEVWNRLGRPEAKEGYEAPKVAGIENIPAGRLEEFQSKAHELGLTGKQFTQILEWSVDNDKRLTETAVAALRDDQQKSITALKTEWGGAFEENAALAKRAVEALGGDDLRRLMNDAAIGDNPVMVKVFSKIGKMMAEDTAVFPGFSGGGGKFSSLTPDEARQKALDMSNDKEIGPILRNTRHARHEALQAEYMQYWEISGGRKQITT